MTEPDPITHDVAVIGGGLAGLSAAITAGAAHPDLRVVLLDGHPVGGRARCDERSGFVFNRGPRAVYAGGPFDRFLQSRGIARNGSPAPVEGGTVLHRGRLHLMPATPVAAMRTSLFTIREKAVIGRAFSRVPKLDPERYRGRTLNDLAADLRLTGTPAGFLEALVRLATYANAPDLLDAGAALAQVQTATGAGVQYLDGGWQPVVDALERDAGTLAVHRPAGAGVQAIHRTGGDDAFDLDLTDGCLRARSVIVAAGGPGAAAELLGDLSINGVEAGPASVVACLELGLLRPPPTRFVLGLDEPVYLSTHAPPAKLAPEGGAVVHLMRYLQPDEHLDADAVREQLRGVAALAGIGRADIAEERYLARMTVTHGIPLAGSGGLPARPPVALPDRPGLFVAGDWVGPDGLLADAAVASGCAAGRLAAERALRAPVR